jgi:hypothetical protein
MLAIKLLDSMILLYNLDNIKRLSTRHSISLPNCKTPHIVRTYRSSMMAVNVLQTYFLFNKLDIIKELTA